MGAHHVFLQLLHAKGGAFGTKMHPLLSTVNEDRIQVVNGALSISSLTLSDTGMYQCIAENRHGRVFANAELRAIAVAPDFSNSVLKAQTLARQGGDVLIECRPRMSPRGMISWRKGKEALRESHRYFYQPISLCLPRTCLLK
ncbi:contactin-4-like [Megalobrama amblycephala]|uniref:contactin-4-like n=1 Tax=Megalobrama amblycephala TaxID=75352 RepID=UPI002013DFC5|nr:contactin-4-like [Megalobrama amblycephala]